MQQRSTLRILFSAFLLALSVLGIVNVVGDNADVVTQARNLACGSDTCDAHLGEMSRNPFWQSFRFDIGGKQPKSTSVECHRDFYFVGAYQCIIK